jgi:hypothetical protein
VEVTSFAAGSGAFSGITRLERDRFSAALANRWKGEGARRTEDLDLTRGQPGWQWEIASR